METGTEMYKRLFAFFSASVVFTGVVCAYAENYIYTPVKANDSSVSSAPGSILTTEITIEKGDTLYSLARKHIGKGIYYPQILLFNEIKDPNLIYAGTLVRIPIKTNSISSQGDDKTEEKPHNLKPIVPVKRAGRASAEKPVIKVNSVKADTDSDLYSLAVAAYKRGDCESAAPLFERFLNTFKDSPFAADAALYKADCYLKLSNL